MSYKKFAKKLWKFFIKREKTSNFDKYFFFPFLAAIDASLITGLLIGYVFYVRIPRQEQSITNLSKRAIQGTWIVETKTSSASRQEYNNLKLRYLVSLTVDNDLNINGVAYKVKETNSQNEEIDFDRRFRSKAIITGSVVDYEFIMNWNISDNQKEESIQTLRGQINKGIIKGSFYNDVADQFGIFCARRAYLDSQIPIDKIKLDCS